MYTHTEAVSVFQALADSLPHSPPAAGPDAAGEGHGQSEPPAGAKTPLTGKKRSREGLEGVLLTHGLTPLDPDCRA